MISDNLLEESNVYEKYYLPCARCGTTKNLSRHHIKDKNGKKTGKIEILCRECHDEAEIEYMELGIVKLNEPAQKFGVLNQKPHKAKNDDLQKSELIQIIAAQISEILQEPCVFIDNDFSPYTVKKWDGYI